MGRKKSGGRKKPTHAHQNGKKRCLTTYKAKKQQRLKKLKDLSSNLRPKAYKKIDNGKANAMRIRLGANTKYHIDPLAGYSNVIKLYMDSKTSDEAKSALDERRRKVNLMKPLLPPKVIKDRILKIALQSTKSKLAEPKDSRIPEEYAAGNSAYTQNELDLQYLNIAASIKESSTTKYHMKNIEVEAAKFNLCKMQQQHIDSLQEADTNDEDILKG